MSDLNPAQAIFIAAILLYTFVAACSDLRSRRIPNLLTVPMCLSGFAWQTGFHGWDGLRTGLAGFAVGFGILFVLWMIGSAGGGDLKLMGGLSVWLGAGLTLKVLLVSLLFVAVGTFGLLLGSLLSRGWRRTRQRYADRASARDAVRQGGDVRSRRRVMAFAVPVALATWCVLAVFRNQW